MLEKIKYLMVFFFNILCYTYIKVRKVFRWENMESKRKMKKSVIFIVIALILVIGGLVGGIIYKNYRDDKLAKEKAQRKVAEEKEILETMKANYSNYVIIDKASKLYKLDNDKYIEIGEVSSNTILELEEIENITLDNQYFK